MPPLPKNQNKRDFPGRRWLSISLRSLHLVGVVLLGAALLGYVAGQMIISDPGVQAWLPSLPEWSAKVVGVFGALLVVIVGRWLERRILARQDVTIV